MLPKLQRLSRLDFIKVKKHSISHHFPELSFLISLNNLPTSRYSVVTSTKLSKQAVVRNRLRREIYAYLGTKQHTTNVDCIIFPKPSVLKLSHDQITTLLDQLISEISHHRT